MTTERRNFSFMPITREEIERIENQTIIHWNREYLTLFEEPALRCFHDEWLRRPLKASAGVGSVSAAQGKEGIPGRAAAAAVGAGSTPARAEPTSAELLPCSGCSVSCPGGLCVYCSVRQKHDDQVLAYRMRTDLGHQEYWEKRIEAWGASERIPQTATSRELAKPHPWECDE